MSHLLLAHLSKDNNCPKLVHNLFNTHARGTQVVVASRFEETPVYYIGSTQKVNNYQPALEAQYSLF